MLVRSFVPAGMLLSMSRMSISQALMQSRTTDLGEKSFVAVRAKLGFRPLFEIATTH